MEELEILSTTCRICCFKKQTCRMCLSPFHPKLESFSNNLSSLFFSRYLRWSHAARFSLDDCLICPPGYSELIDLLYSFTHSPTQTYILTRILWIDVLLCLPPPRCCINDFDNQFTQNRWFCYAPLQIPKIDILLRSPQMYAKLIFILSQLTRTDLSVCPSSVQSEYI